MSVRSPKIPSHMSLTALLHGGLTSVTSIIYIVLCILGIVFRRLCDYVNIDNERGSEYFSNIFYRVYIIDSTCSNFITPNQAEVISSDTVFIFLILILIISVLTLTASATLTIVLYQERAEKYLNATLITHIVLCLVSFVIDLVIGTMFGIDYSKLSDNLNSSSGGLSINYFIDTLRLGAMLLMSVSLKGYVYHVINIVFIIILCLQLAEYNKQNEHSIHKLGALKAYDQRQRNSSYHQPEMVLGLARGQPLNPAFLHDDDPPVSAARSTTRDYSEPPASDYSNRFLDRSESWQGRSFNSGSRPFSYLGNSNRTATAPAAARAPAPPIPAPDYSPLAGKRLKSVLKPAYL